MRTRPSEYITIHLGQPYEIHISRGNPSHVAWHWYVNRVECVMRRVDKDGEVYYTFEAKGRLVQFGNTNNWRQILNRILIHV